MGFIDTIKGIFQSNQTEPPLSPTAARHAGLPRVGQRARFSRDDAQDLPFNSSLYVVAPTDAESFWRVQSLDSRTLSRMAPARLIELLADLSPEVSRGLWDFMRLFNPGWECTVTRLNSEVKERRGQQAVDDFFKLLGDLYISYDVPINALIMAGFLRGAFFGEIVLDKAGRLPVDLATPDPYWARFNKVSDPVRGTIYQLGQYQGGQWVPLDIPTVAYVPIDKFPNNPYGRSPALPALFAAIFLLGMLHDLRRVVQQQGYPRLDLAVAMEALREMMPADIEAGSEEFEKWVNATIDEISSMYGTLLPDDAYVHTDVVTVNRPVGAVDSSSLGAIDGLIEGLERMITRALKSVPLLMGLGQSASETEANRQWEIFAAGIKSIQHLLEAMLQRLLTVMLQAQGIQARVEFRFAELRAAEELRDQQTLTMKIANATAMYEAGHITQDEAAMMTAGHAAAEPEPRRAPAPPQFAQGDGDGQPAADDESRMPRLLELADVFQMLLRADQERELTSEADLLKWFTEREQNGNGHG